MSMVSPSSTSSVDASNPASRLVTLPPWDFDGGVRTLGFEAARWAERWLVQPNGPKAGQKFTLTPGQLTFLLHWYSVDDQGDWLFTHGVRRLAKGSGKSPFAAVLALIEFCAPVRLDRFDDRVLGGCQGRPVSMPLVQIAATAESQTANTMRMVRAFAPKGSKVVDAHGLDPGKTRYYRQPEGTLEIVTSSFTAAEGAEPSFDIADETEHWKPANGGIDLAATLQDNLAKSGSRMLETSNAWTPGTESVAEATWDAWVAQEEGLTRGETKILYDARIAPPNTDMADTDSLRAALEFVYADCDWQNPRPIMERIWKLNARPEDSQIKYLNWPAVAADAWTTPEAWKLLADREKVMAPGDEVVLFFDGSKSGDATALVGCRLSDGHVFTVDVWEPTSEAVVPVGEVDLAVEYVFDRFEVAAFFADVKEWESFTKVEWPARYADRLRLMAVPSGKDPQPIAWDMRSHTYEFTLAVELVETEIAEQSFTHDDDPRLGRHVVNMRRRPNRYGISVGKSSPKSPKKIDAGVCMIGARMARRLVLAAAPKKNQSSMGWTG